MKLILLGDMAFFGCCSLTTNSKAEEYFAEVAEFLKNADYVVGNLETPFSVKKKTNGAKSAYICSDVENVELLKLLHINAVTLANNHMFDYGKEGYETTKRVLEENGIEYFGSEGKSLIVEMLGNKLAFEGFCCFSSNPLQTVPYGEYGVNEYKVQKADEIIAWHEKNGCLPIVAVHAGLEHVNYPSLEHVDAARYLASKHKYIYYGHHPHVVQGIEEKHGSLLAYSLGNFCFDDVWSSVNKEKPLVELMENNRNGFMLKLEIENNIILSWKAVPIYIGREKMLLGKNTYVQSSIKQCIISLNSYSRNEYNYKRQALLDERMDERKKERNLKWYLKRLRPRYVKLVFTSRKNSIKYKENIKIKKI